MQKKYIYMLVILLIILFIYIIVHHSKTIETYDGGEPEFYIFGYGSLVNDYSRKETVLLKKAPVMATISENFGYQRAYGFKSEDSPHRVFGLQQNPSYNSKINGVLFKVNSEDLARLDFREKSYEKIVIPWNYVINREALVKENKLEKNYDKYTLFTYFPNDEMSINKNNDSISYDYLDKVYDGFYNKVDDDSFLTEFINNTDNSTLPSDYTTVDNWINS